MDGGIAPRPLERIEHASALGRWCLVRAAPAPALHPLVLGYEDYVEWGANTIARQELPTTVVPLILTFEGAFHLRADTGGPWQRLADGFAAGLHTAPVTVRASGPVHCVQVDLTPLGARRLLHLPLGRLRQTTVDVEAVLGVAVRSLRQQLGDAPDAPARFDLLDRFFGRRLMQPTPPAMERAWQRLAAAHGRLAVADLAAEIGMARQQLHAAFRTTFGVGPKTAARLLRFERAVALMDRRPALPLVEVALATGYCDQAHFNRDFRRFAGEAPTAFARRRLADGTGIFAREG